MYNIFTMLVRKFKFKTFYLFLFVKVFSANLQSDFKNNSTELKAAF